MSNERDAATIKKKWKNNVTSDLDNDVQLAVKDHAKKKKSKVLGDILLDGVSDLDTDNESKSLRKEKKKKDRIKKDEVIVSETREEGHQKKKKKKKKKNKTESNGKKELIDNVSDDNSFKNKKEKKVEEFVDTLIENSGNVGQDDRLGGEIGNEYMKKNKKKKNRVEKCKENKCVGGDVSSLENKSDEVEPVKVPKQKKKKVSVKKKGDTNACNSKTEDIDRTGVEEKTKKNKKKEDEFGDKVGKKRKGKSLVIDNDDDDDANVDNNSRSSKKSKKVKFSENIEVFPLDNSSSKGKKKKVEDGNKDNKTKSKDGLIRGKRFSKEEDEILREAVLKYIEDHQLGEEGISMVMNSVSHPEIRGCWKEIREALPHRPSESIRYRAHILFERREARKWTKEELELVKKFYEKHGPNWRALADELGIHRVHVKDLWRRNRLPNMKKGHWSQEEYQNLFNLVNVDLSMKTFTEKKSKHGMLRDNICWEVISEQLSTRSSPVCCLKWYAQLMSPMVTEGLWANADDYRLLIALSELDASCEEDVDWDNLLEHRSGDICRKRWNQMVRHIGENGTKGFSEQVDVLSQRYCPNILEAREDYDNRSPVD